MNILKKYSIVFIIFIFALCNNSSINLPQSCYCTKVPKPSITRNVFFQLRGNLLYHEDSLVTDLKHFYWHLDDFIEMNDGSNNFRVVFAAPETTKYPVLDSIFYQFAKDTYFRKFFLLTNSLKDSCGLKTFIAFEPPDSTYGFDSIEFESAVNANKVYKVTIDNNKIYMNGCRIKKRDLKEAFKKIILIDKHLAIFPYNENTYSELIFLLGTYHYCLNEIKNEYALKEYDNPYSSLPKFKAEEIDFQFQPRVSIIYIYSRISKW